MLLLAAVALTAAPPANALQSVPSNCPRTTSYYAWKDGRPLKLHRLTELPPGNMYVAVFRRDARGCEAPIVVKYGLGRR